MHTETKGQINPTTAAFFSVLIIAAFISMIMIAYDYFFLSHVQSSCLDDYAKKYCASQNLSFSATSWDNQFSCYYTTGDERIGIKNNYTYFYFTKQEQSTCTIPPRVRFRR